MYRLGIDLGSSYIKGVLVNSDNNVIDRMAVKTGFDFTRAAGKIITGFTKKYDVQFPVFTCGYGREQVTIPYIPNSEIMAIARAVFEIYAKPCTVVDIGGQDNKFIKINGQGQVDKFKMNRKCAAGTGSFIEEIAFKLGLQPAEFSDLAGQAAKEVKINSYCTVFAVSEIIGLIKKGITLPEVAKGIYNSVIDRAMEISLVEDALIITGGVVEYHPFILDLFRKRHANCESPENSQFLAAWGSVLLNNDN